MKLPRWLVIGMLTSSVLAVLAAAGCWWVTWPEWRAVREFNPWDSLVRWNRLLARSAERFGDSVVELLAEGRGVVEPAG